MRLRRSTGRALHHALHFDPGARLLRATALGMITVLGTYAWSLWIENRAGLYVDSVVQAVVISSAFARVQRVHDRTDRLIACLVLPCAAAGGMQLTALIRDHPDAGDVLFTLGVAASVWVRRFGLRATRAGTLVVLPLVAVLVVPGGAPAQGYAPTGWAALTALFAVAWGTAVTWIGHRTGLVPRPPSAAVATMPVPDRPGLRAGTRMALQSTAALGTAFALGRVLWPDHWTWVVLTAFLVGSGARSRGDVLVKGVWRTLGAAAGTVVAGAVAGSFPPHSDTVVVIIFSVLAAATWLRELSYAYWAGCVTAVLSLLYDWFGQDAGSLLDTRLAGIAVGAVLGIAASWLVLPIRTSGTVRSRTAAALAGLGEVLSADPHDTRAVRVTQARFLFRLEQLRLAAAPLRVAESLPVPSALAARWRKRGLAILAAPVALGRCAEPLGAYATAVTRAPDAVATDPDLSRRHQEVAAHGLAVRRAIGRRPAPATSGDVTVLAPAEGTPLDPTDGTTPAPVRGTTVDPTNDSTLDPTDGRTVDRVDGTTLDPTDGTTPAPVRGTTADPTNDSTLDPTDGRTVDRVDGTTLDPTDGTTPAPVRGTTADPTNDSTLDPTDGRTVDRVDGTTLGPSGATSPAAAPAQGGRSDPAAPLGSGRTSDRSAGVCPSAAAPTGPRTPAVVTRSPEVTTAHAALDAISLQLDALTELFGHPPTVSAPPPVPAPAASG
ncbi:FUSC family protein [Streptomyces sp. NBC_01390]|uniref:FUSC family protein n=1 Tax=Streptomyces sp. NBC_01390 TaxID=2903850 RepID=UPI00324921A5